MKHTAKTRKTLKHAAKKKRTHCKTMKHTATHGRHALVQSAVLFKAWLLLRQRSHVLWQKQQRMRIKHAREILRERCAKWGAITRTARCHTGVCRVSDCLLYSTVWY